MFQVRENRRCSKCADVNDLILHQLIHIFHGLLLFLATFILAFRICAAGRSILLSSLASLPVTL